MKVELDAFDANHTWQITSLPPGKKTIGCRRIYKIKYKSNGSVDHYKARLFVKGYTQLEGLDLDTFALVAKLTTLRLLLALIATHNWMIIISSYMETCMKKFTCSLPWSSSL